MRKRFVLFVLLGVLVLGLTAQAVNPRQSGRPVLSFNGTTAICSGTCLGDNSTDRINVTLTLYHGDAYVDSWSGSGVIRVLVSGNCTVERGETYRLVMTWSVNGVEQQPVEAVGTCR